MTQGTQTLVAQSTRADGVGKALREAFREPLSSLPADMRALLEKLR